MYQRYPLCIGLKWLIRHLVCTWYNISVYLVYISMPRMYKYTWYDICQHASYISVHLVYTSIPAHRVWTRVCSICIQSKEDSASVRTSLDPLFTVERKNKEENLNLRRRKALYLFSRSHRLSCTGSLRFRQLLGDTCYLDLIIQNACAPPALALMVQDSSLFQPSCT